MALSRCAPRVEITPPSARPRRFGLYSAAEIRDVADGTWSHGIQYRSESCSGNVYTWPKPCPPACEPECTYATSLMVQLDHQTETTNCGTFSVITASVTEPAQPKDLPFRTVITVTTECGLSADIAPGDGVVTIQRRLVENPAAVMVTVRQSLNGTEKTASIPPGQQVGVPILISSALPRQKVLDGIGPWLGADPVPLYSSVHCTPGAGFAAEAKRLASDRLVCNEECAVEEYLWTQLPLSGARYVGNPASPLPLLEALGAVEQAMAQDRSCSAGVIHMPMNLSFLLPASRFQSVDPDDQKLFTRIGTQLVFGACYDGDIRPDGQAPTAGQAVIIGTGPVIVQRGPVSAYEGLDKETNDYAAIAERTVAVIADCPIVWTVANIDKANE